MDNPSRPDTLFIAEQYSIQGLTARVREKIQRSPRMLPDMFWTFASNLVSAVSGLFIFKIISRYVPANEYGEASLALGVIGLLSQLIAGPIISAHFRLYFEHAKAGWGRAYSIAVRKLLLWISALMAALYLVFAAVNLEFSNEVYWSLAVPSIFLLLAQTQLTGTFTFLEAEKRYRSLTFAMSLSKVLLVPFLLLLLVASMAGPSSIVYSQVLAGAAVAVAWGLDFKSNAPVPTNAPRFGLKQIVGSGFEAFGWSFFLFSLFSWILATSDRYIIAHYWTTKEVGIYAINYGLWSMPYLALSAWLEGLVRSRMFERSELQDWRGVQSILRHRLRLTLLLGGVLTGILLWAGKRIAFLIIGQRYWHSTMLLGLICSAHFLYVSGMAFHTVFVASKTVTTMARIIIAASVVNLAMNFFLIPKLGIIGAAWGTMIPYAFIFIFMVGFGSNLLGKLALEESK